MQDHRKTKGQLIDELRALRMQVATGKTQGPAGQDAMCAPARDAKIAPHESEAWYKNLVRTIPDLVWLKDVNGVYLNCNPAFDDFIGKGAAAIVGKTDYDLFDKNLADFFRENDAKAIETGGPNSNEEWLSSPGEGRRSLFETIKTPLYGSDGALAGVLGIARDITERKQAQETLRYCVRALKSYGMSDAALDSAVDELSLCTQFCRILVESCGYTMAWVGVAEPDSRKCVRPVSQWGADDGYLKAVTITWDDSRTGRGPTGLAIKSKTPQVARFIDTDPRFTPWREAAQARGFKSSIALPLCDKARCLGALTIYAREPDAFDTHEVEILSHVAKKLTFGVYALRERGKRIVAERALAGSNEQYRLLVENAGDAIYLTGEDGRILDVNPEAERQTCYGRDELLRMTVLDLDMMQTAQTFGAFVTRLHGEKRVFREGAYRRRNGSTFPVEITSVFMTLPEGRCILSISRDITERRHMQEMLIQHEKMVSVAGIAAGVAHEINNPLGGIIQGLQVVSRRLDAGLEANAAVAGEVGLPFAALRAYLDRREIPALLGDVREMAVRTANTVSGMLAFSRKNESHKKPADINALLTTALELSAADYDLRKRFDFEKVEIQKDYAADLPLVICSASQIEQVFLNLLRNAVQALKGGEAARARPRIILRTRRKGDTVEIEFADNGPGMDDEVHRRIFEPFFTTKAVQEGTGLGLSVSYFIVVNNHGGSIETVSAPGRGTRFIVKLPIEADTREGRAAS